MREPDHTAVRVALWRALHAQIDQPPLVLEDTLGLQLVAPEDDWRARPDMHPMGPGRTRASIVARARFVEDLVVEHAARGVDQYVILGAGLDTFAQRRPDVGVQIFEVEQPGTQAWKQARLAALGFPTPPSLHFVPVDFASNESWLEKIAAAGFARDRPAVLASTGVLMYLPHEAIVAMFREIATLAPGSTFAVTYILPLDRIEHPGERAGLEAAARGAAERGTPFRSFFTPESIAALAREAGFSQLANVSGDDLAARYFAGRTDGLRPTNGEQFLVATV